jgi:hypothetical protein
MVAAMIPHRGTIRTLRAKEPPTTPLVNRATATKWARRLAVQFGVGELHFAPKMFVAEATVRDANNIFWGNHLVAAGKPHPFQRLISIGIARALVGV